MASHVIKTGLDIPIKGQATGTPVELPTPKTVAYAPTEIRGLVPRVVAKAGAKVKQGDVLFHHKPNAELVFRSPISGTVKEVRRGARRVITDVIVESDGTNEQTHWPAVTAAALGAMDRDTAKAAILRTGLWSILQTRPMDAMADPDDSPQAILVSGTETGPLMPSAAVLMADMSAEHLQLGLAALAKLTNGSVHLTLPTSDVPPALQSKDVQTHTFSGPHPAGDAAVQVNLVCPPKGTGKVWTAKAWDVALLGKALATGLFPAERIYAAVGAGVKTPRFVKTVLGAPIADIAGEVTAGEQRYIRGSVLTGESVSGDRWASSKKMAIHVLPEEVPQYMFGWALPRFGAWSFHKAFFSGIFGSKPSGGEDMRPGLYGGVRAIVPFGVYEKVVATPDILPEYLFKAIVAGDLEESISLGLLDLSIEEAALCTYICPSKVDCDVLLRQGLDLYEREA